MLKKKIDLSNLSYLWGTKDFVFSTHWALKRKFLTVKMLQTLFVSNVPLGYVQAGIEFRAVDGELASNAGNTPNVEVFFDKDYDNLGKLLKPLEICESHLCGLNSKASSYLYYTNDKNIVAINGDYKILLTYFEGIFIEQGKPINLLYKGDVVGVLMPMKYPGTISQFIELLQSV